MKFICVVFMKKTLGQINDCRCCEHNFRKVAFLLHPGTCREGKHNFFHPSNFSTGTPVTKIQINKRKSNRNRLICIFDTYSYMRYPGNE